MKKLNLFATILFTGALLVGGCSNDSEDVTAGKKGYPIVENKDANAGVTIEQGDGYGFNEFDLDIEIDGKDVIDIEYDVTEKAEADYKNELTNVNVEDAEAMDEVDKLFMHILLTNTMSEKEVVENILEFLRIDNYSKFELKINFNDGTNLNINDQK